MALRSLSRYEAPTGRRSRPGSKPCCEPERYSRPLLKHPLRIQIGRVDIISSESHIENPHARLYSPTRWSTKRPLLKGANLKGVMIMSIVITTPTGNVGGRALQQLL